MKHNFGREPEAFPAGLPELPADFRLIRCSEAAPGDRVFIHELAP